MLIVYVLNNLLEYFSFCSLLVHGMILLLYLILASKVNKQNKKKIDILSILLIIYRKAIEAISIFSPWLGSVACLLNWV